MAMSFLIATSDAEAFMSFRDMVVVALAPQGRY